MNIESLREYALGKPSVTEGFPFGEDVIVFKINGKIFLLMALNSQPLQMNVKCNPDTAEELRVEFPGTVLPGYHMNKRHWNTILINGVLNSKQLKQMIDESYKLVLGKKKI